MKAVQLDNFQPIYGAKAGHWLITSADGKEELTGAWPTEAGAWRELAGNALIFAVSSEMNRLLERAKS